MLKIAFQNFYISKFSGGGGGACPRTPLATRAFGAWTFLPRLSLKSGYGPVQMKEIPNGFVWRPPQRSAMHQKWVTGLAADVFISSFSLTALIAKVYWSRGSNFEQMR